MICLFSRTVGFSRGMYQYQRKKGRKGEQAMVFHSAPKHDINLTGPIKRQSET